MFAGLRILFKNEVIESDSIIYLTWFTIIIYSFHFQIIVFSFCPKFGYCLVYHCFKRGFRDEDMVHWVTCLLHKHDVLRSNSLYTYKIVWQPAHVTMALGFDLGDRHRRILAVCCPSSLFKILSFMLKFLSQNIQGREIEEDTQYRHLANLCANIESLEKHTDTHA